MPRKDGAATAHRRRYEVLVSYVNVMKPIATAMDLLQGEEDCYIGHVIPTIKGIQHKLKLLTDKSMTPLINGINDGLQQRFSDIMNSDDYNVATMLIPKFKLNYLEINRRTIMKDLLIRSVQGASEVDETSSPATAAAIEPADDNLFSFMNESCSHSTVLDAVTAEVDNFLACNSTDTTSLTAFPRVATAFRKYNAALPSSAAVERLFSTAGQILTDRRCKMSDTLFEQAVFLRYKLKE